MGLSALQARLVQVLDELSEGNGPEDSELSRLLTDGCARAHELEMRCLQLERRSQAIVDGHGDLDAFASVRREERRLRRELSVLRGRLGLIRGAAGHSQAR